MEYQGETLRCLLALLRMPGVGPVKIAKILKLQPDLNGIFDSKGQCLFLKGSADWVGVEKDLQWMNAPGCHLVTQQSSQYPLLLKEMPGAPLLLFVRGNVKILSRPQIALVGSRNPTAVGCETAFNFARYFSMQGLAVTSGLAMGIDGSSHKGALLGEGGTLAVLANGLDTIYPAAHQALAHEIVEKGGALVSEFSIGVPPMPSHFPQRNRIISGLSMGTLVVEAALNSGSLITAKFAVEQGREVFAIPGSLHNPLAKGCHALIRQGAKLVETAADVLEELGALRLYEGFEQKANLQENKNYAENKNLTVLEKEGYPEPYHKVLTQVGYECTPIDKVVNQSGLTTRAVSSMLLELELKGYIAAVPGGYVKVLANS